MKAKKEVEAMMNRATKAVAAVAMKKYETLSLREQYESALKMRDKLDKAIAVMEELLRKENQKQ